MSFEQWRSVMLEPIEHSKDENSNIQLDREVLSAMLKAWLVPRSTGKLSNSEEEDYKKESRSPKVQWKDNPSKNT
jgi:hypothetical protein